MKRTVGWVLGILVLAAGVRAAVVEKVVEYKQGGVVLSGFLAAPEGVQGKVPGILVVHEWMGLGDYEKSRVRQLAELGYVAFAADIYGKGDRPADMKAASEVSGKYKNDRKLLRARAKAALDVLRKDPRVDGKKTAAIGYCFGGTTVLEMARSGMPVLGVVSFHGGLDTPQPASKGSIHCKVLAIQGADDPFYGFDAVTAFEKEMKDSGADWQMVELGGAGHSFTNPAAKGTMKGLQYDAKADRRSWRMMKDFFEELFGSK